MTSVIAWLAVDSRGPTALYFASDSRITHNDGSKSDNAAKVFVARAGLNRSEIFAFAGDVNFAQPSLVKLCRAIEQGGIDLSLASSAYGRAEWAFGFLLRELASSERGLGHYTTILHGSRNSWGPNANFVIHSYSGKKGSLILEMSEDSISAASSSYITATCSGSGNIIDEVIEETIIAGRHSRSYFTAFCDAVRRGSDPSSGGPVQLVGIGNKSEAQFYGVVLRDGAYYKGKRFEGGDNEILWFNESFERVDRNGQLLSGAQRHATIRLREK